MKQMDNIMDSFENRSEGDSGHGTNRRVNIELGPDLQDEYEYWLEAKRSLCVERSIINFLIS